jgi:hypothetical protein
MQPVRWERADCAKQAEYENSKENGLICLSESRVSCGFISVSEFLTAQT